MRASFRQSGQLADHRSGTLVAERPDEQLAPKMPIFSALALYIAARSGNDPVRLSMAVPGVRNVPENSTPSVCRVEWACRLAAAIGGRAAFDRLSLNADRPRERNNPQRPRQAPE